MFSVKVAGRWLRSLGGYGPVTVEHGPHGPEAASWDMAATFRHPLVRGNAAVEVYDGGMPVFSGTLNEPGSDGKFTAKGLWHQGETIYPLDASLAFTSVPDVAIAQAFARGEITWKQYVSVSAVAWANAGADVTLAQLLNGYAAENAMRWTVDGAGELSVQADPTVPRWHVPHAVAGRGLTPAEDEFATHMVGRYLNLSSVYASVSVGSAEATAVFGRRSVRVDLTEAGPIDATKATSILTGMFLRSGARMGWGEGLDLAFGQIVTPGGTPAPLAQIRSGQMIRLAGTVDTSRPNRLTAYTDIVAETVKYTEGSGVISITPFGYSPRNLSDVLTLAVAA